MTDNIIAMTQEIMQDMDLKRVGLEMMFLTPDKYRSSDGITATELAKCAELPCETVKKKLKILLDRKLVIVTGNNPKYWKFDEYNYKRISEEDEVYLLLCNMDEEDFNRYFDYDKFKN